MKLECQEFLLNCADHFIEADLAADSRIGGDTRRDTIRVLTQEARPEDPIAVLHRPASIHITASRTNAGEAHP